MVRRSGVSYFVEVREGPLVNRHRPSVEAPAPPKGFQVIQAPVNVPVSIPKIDLSAAVTGSAKAREMRMSFGRVMLS